MLVSLICARKNSKGLPGKNIAPLGGMPLIAHSITMAASINAIDRIIVSTDCPEIAAVAEAHGATVPGLRPAELAGDASPEWLVWRHALENFVEDYRNVDGLVVLPPTGPLREKADVEQAIGLYQGGDCDVVITTTPSHRNPLFNMVKPAEDGLVELGMKPEATIHRRQDAPRFYDITTNCYIVSPALVMNANGLFDGRVRQVVVSAETAVDIDTKIDLEWAEFLMNQRAQRNDK